MAYIQAIDKAKARFNFAEKLIHTTKYNTAKYDFDAKFYKFPSYLRRAAIQAALGSVSSYYSNHKNWETNGKVGKEPNFNAIDSASRLFTGRLCTRKATNPTSAI